MKEKVPLRGIAAAAAMLVQLAAVLGLTAALCRAFGWFAWGMRAAGIVAALHVAMRREKDAYKLSWVLLIVLFPHLGGAAYALLARRSSARSFAARMDAARALAQPAYERAGSAFDDACALMPQDAPQIRYLQAYAGFPIYADAGATYCPTGEDFFDALKCALEHAQRFIFLEFFIIAEGTMWDEILEILRHKAKEGVCVRVLCDDLGCAARMGKGYPARLRAQGIECAVFNPLRPVLTAAQNNRDHRKIAVVDGDTAFTGGINLADEYINAIEKHGHWKDTALCVRGGAALSMALMFLQMWAVCTGKREDFLRFMPEAACGGGRGFAQPFADSPAHAPHVSEQVYLHIIRSAREYVYINTPYLAADGGMMDALAHAAHSGVDVRMVVPGIWDKEVARLTSSAYIRELLRAGVKVYAYSPGFMHAKSLVADDRTAAVGTANLDYRSLYLHFECGVWLLEAEVVMQVKEDFLCTLRQCAPLDEGALARSAPGRVLEEWMRIAAPGI